MKVNELSKEEFGRHVTQLFHEKANLAFEKDYIMSTARRTKKPGPIDPGQQIHMGTNYEQPQKTRWTFDEVQRELQDQRQRLERPFTDFDKFESTKSSLGEIRHEIKHMEQRLKDMRDSEADFQQTLKDLGDKIETFVASVRRS